LLRLAMIDPPVTATAILATKPLPMRTNNI
jgi:hypothetical protein